MNRLDRFRFRLERQIAQDRLSRILAPYKLGMGSDRIEVDPPIPSDMLDPSLTLYSTRFRLQDVVNWGGTVPVWHAGLAHYRDFHLAEVIADKLADLIRVEIRDALLQRWQNGQ